MNPSIQDAIWALPEPELSKLAQLIDRLLDLRRSFDSAIEQSPGPPERNNNAGALPPAGGLPPTRATVAKALHLARRPLRRPRPGSLRGDVHAVLRNAAAPLSRAEIAGRVAALRKTPCNDSLTNKVGEVLRCPHDTGIRKLRHGIYRYAH